MTEKYQPRVLVMNRDGVPAFPPVQMTEELLRKISRFNGAMSPEAVRVALQQGQRVYTNFRSYELEA